MEDFTPSPFDANRHADGQMTSQEIKKYLSELGTELERRGIKEPVRILLIGGAYMMLLANAPHTTDDIDFFWLEQGEAFRYITSALNRKQELTMMPKTIQTMTWAYEQICKGEDPWTALGNFTNAWYGYAKDIRATLVHEPLIKPEQDTEYTHQWAAFCAASVEFLCDRYNIPHPDWVNDPYYILTIPWWHTKWIHNAALQERLMYSTPTPFARRNIFCGNRLYQNKYEMSEWVQEAYSKGITNPGDIWRYARQKEISIHGA